MKNHQKTRQVKGLNFSGRSVEKKFNNLNSGQAFKYRHFGQRRQMTLDNAGDLATKNFVKLLLAETRRKR
ncbi:hypothetical protein EMIT0P228_20575 [Pseudomonas brassicacearum]